MRIEWVILIISAITDFIITSGTAITTAMLATGTASIPNDAVMIWAVIGGCVAAARTVQQKLNVTPEALANLRGNPPAPQPVIVQQPKSQPVPVQQTPPPPVTMGTPPKPAVTTATSVQPKK